MKNYDLYFASCLEDGGIYHYRLEDGELHFREKMPCDRPMYMIFDENGDMLAVLRSPFPDNKDSGLVAFNVDENGTLTSKGEIISTLGQVGCHLCRFEGETYAANYISGSVFGTPDRLDIHRGKGPHPTRQEAPHVHYVSPTPDDRYLLAVDLGLDAVYCYDRNLQVISVSYVPAGHGARHLAFSEDGRVVFCANELASTVTVFAYVDGQLEPLQTVPALETAVWNEQEFTPGSTMAAIRVQGEYVYVSHRGEDKIACLHWDGRQLTLCKVFDCGGQSPRDFLVLEDVIFCTNENSGTVSVLKIDGEDTGVRLEIGAVLCVAAREARKN